MWILMAVFFWILFECQLICDSEVGRNKYCMATVTVYFWIQFHEFYKQRSMDLSHQFLVNVYQGVHPGTQSQRWVPVNEVAWWAGFCLPYMEEQEHAYTYIHIRIYAYMISPYCPLVNVYITMEHNHGRSPCYSWDSTHYFYGDVQVRELLVITRR